MISKPQLSNLTTEQLFQKRIPAPRLYRFIILLAACVWLSSTLGLSVSAAALPTGFTETQVSGLSGPTAMEIAPDGRLFVCLQGGQLRVIKNGVLLATPFLTLTLDSNGERGLLGIAFDPNFVTNQFVYVYYTATTPAIHNRVSRFTANGDVSVGGSEVVILDLNNLSSASNHNGGAIHFGPDGKLYVAVGENANGANSQTLTNRLGKMLRINSDGTIPSDNPSTFLGITGSTSGDNRAIWSVGLRNPFTFAFQPSTGRMFINDVGQSTWEEINDGIAGSNYGWPTTEGMTTDVRFRTPLFVFGHGSSNTTGCAIAGGAFYNPANVQFPASYVGKYFFADLCGGWIRVLDPSNNTATGFATGISSPVDLKVAPDGSLYYLAIGSSSVFRVQFPTATITTQPANQTVIAGQTAMFSVSANGAPTLSYQWQRNSGNISGANSSSYSFSTVLADNGAKFRCVVSNGLGSATSDEATLTVIPDPPAPHLVTDFTDLVMDFTDSAIAFNSVTMVRDPFSLLTTSSLSPTLPTRIMIFALNGDLLPTEDRSAVTVQAENAMGMNLDPMTVEYVGTVPGFSSLTEVVVVLPGTLPSNSDVFVSMTLRGKTSNRVRIKIQ